MKSGLPASPLPCPRAPDLALSHTAGETTPPSGPPPEAESRLGQVGKSTGLRIRDTWGQDQPVLLTAVPPAVSEAQFSYAANWEQRELPSALRGVIVRTQNV